MKKYLLILISSFVLAQEKDHYVAVLTGLDVKNATELDVVTKFIMVGQGFEVNIVFESFQKISFSKFGFGVGYQIQLYAYIGNKEIKTVFIPSVEPSLINRWGEEWQCSSSHLSIGLNASFRWFFNDHLGAEILINALPRTDLQARYPEINSNAPVVVSGFACLVWKI